MELAEAARRQVDEVLAELGATREGITDAEADRRRAEVGHNVLATHHVTAFQVLWRQVRNPLLILLLAAATVSAATGDPTDGIIIAVIVTVSVGLGFVNEYRSEAAVAALHAGVRHEAVLHRPSGARRVDVRDLVPGDVVELELGGLVPADVRLIESDDLECDESVLTGEASAAVKSSEPSPPSDSAIDLPSCAFMGTVVRQGRATAVVVRTGAATQFGEIAAGLATVPTVTAFQEGLAGFSRFLVRVAVVLTSSIFVLNVVLHRPLLEALLFSLAIAIGITPQLLPAIVSVSLSAGSRALARKRVLVKRLVVIEDLGNIEILFTDKTGTLTEGSITFDRTIGPDGSPSPEVLRLGLVCNEATPTADGPAGGNALDRALWLAPRAAEVLGVPPERLGSRPFDHDRQMGSVVVRGGDEGATLVVKGAPEAVLARCDGVPDSATDTLDALFAAGARVVAVATRLADGLTEPTPADEAGLRLVGFLSFVDRPKADAAASLAELAALGIEVKVITGDNGKVAETVCRTLGMPVAGTLTGAELAALDDDALAEAVVATSVFARVSPEQKARVVRAARRSGQDVAFLGDGVNDAVALHAADVGISVEGATDVARDAADIVLLEKDLSVLASGVREGRRIFSNTLKYVLMATSSNFGNMFSAAGASLFLSFLPMLPSQILLNNLLYDTGQLAIPTDRVDRELLDRPAAWDLGYVRRFMSVFGPISSVFDFVTFFVMLGVLHAGHAEFRTGWFVESLATQTLVVYVIRTRRIPFFRSRPSGPMLVMPIAAALTGAFVTFSPLSATLGFARLPLGFFLILVGMILAYLLLVELAMVAFNRTEQRPHRQRRAPQARREHRVARRAVRFTHHHPPAVRRRQAHLDGRRQAT